MTQTTPLAHPCERSLLPQQHLSKWTGLHGGWYATPQGDARLGTLDLDRPYLALLERGQAVVECVVDAKSAVRNPRAGDMCLLVPNGPRIRHYRWQPRNTRQIKFQPDLRLLCEQGLLDERYRAMPLRQDLNFQDPELASLLRCMAHEIASGCPNGTLFAQSLSLGVARRLIQTHGALGVQPERGRFTPPQARAVRDFIASAFAQDISIDALASMTGVSKPHFARLFRSTFGMPPHRYVLKLRLQESLNMLRTGDTSLADVALLCGFSSQSHFTGAFKKAFGTTPGNVRHTCPSTAPSLSRPPTQPPACC